jgi:O-antigen ligase
MIANRRIKALNSEVIRKIADWLAVGVAVSLPWSTSATSILIAAWLVAGLLCLDVAALRRELATAAGGLPVLLWALAAIGTLWADVSWSDRLGGLGGFHRLLLIPVLLAQFRRSEHGIRVLCGFFISVLGVLLLSWSFALIPGLAWRGHDFGTPVKDYIFQSEEFLIVAFALSGLAFDFSGAHRWRWAAGSVMLAILFLANIIFVASGRTTILVLPFLALLLCLRQFGRKGLFAAIVMGCVVGAATLASPYMRERLTTSVAELQAYRASDASNSTSQHLEFIRKGISFVRTAPIIGHGTGAIGELYRNSVSGQIGAASVPSDNPHNQILAVAIQIGLIGAAVLAAMWIAHLMLFRGPGLAAWFGIIMVVQNVVASLFNSHLFDFAQGWLYVFGIGVLGGMMLRERDGAPAVSACRHSGPRSSRAPASTLMS